MLRIFRNCLPFDSEKISQMTGISIQYPSYKNLQDIFKNGLSNITIQLNSYFKKNLDYNNPLLVCNSLNYIKTKSLVGFKFSLKRQKAFF